MSLNSLDLVGVRLGSRRDSQIFPIVAGAEDTSAGDDTEFKSEFNEVSSRYYVSFPDD